MWFKKRIGEREAAAPPAVIIDGFIGDEGSRQLHAALQSRDWSTARTLLLEAPSAEHFARRLVEAAGAAGLEEWIDGPIRDEPGSTLPLLVKGARHVYWAWEARGSGLSNSVAQDAWQVWFDRLRRAEDCLDEVVAREPGNAEAWHWLIVLARARQVPKDERWRRFAGLIAADPTNYYGHTQMLEALMAKWSGSAEEMFEFARKTVAAHPGTHLPTLIVTAHMEHRYHNGGSKYLERAEVADELVAAAHQSIWHPAYQQSLFTTLVLNNFASALARADRHAEAERCFLEIGDNRVTPRPWDADKEGPEAGFSWWRNYTFNALAAERSDVQVTH